MRLEDLLVNSISLEDPQDSSFSKASSVLMIEHLESLTKIVFSVLCRQVGNRRSCYAAGLLNVNNDNKILESRSLVTTLTYQIQDLYGYCDK